MEHSQSAARPPCGFLTTRTSQYVECPQDPCGTIPTGVRCNKRCHNARVAGARRSATEGTQSYKHRRPAWASAGGVGSGAGGRKVEARVGDTRRRRCELYCEFRGTSRRFRALETRHRCPEHRVITRGCRISSARCPASGTRSGRGLFHQVGERPKSRLQRVRRSEPDVRTLCTSILAHLLAHPRPVHSEACAPLPDSVPSEVGDDSYALHGHTARRGPLPGLRLLSCFRGVAPIVENLSRPRTSDSRGSAMGPRAGRYQLRHPPGGMVRGADPDPG